MTRGFTLLEMMLVIVLLGTVTSMIVPTLSSGTKPVAH
ncbi:MAG: prepilin-type N-terminal cleavage/methylation domain-containing protein, partial [Plesiomonas shigelloides]